MKKPDKVFSLRRKAKQYFTQSLLLFSAVLLITVLGMVAAAKKNDPKLSGIQSGAGRGKH